jgi:hypothetical protein
MDLRDRNLRILNFTSWSMNGAVASIILKAYYPRCKTIFTSYRTQENVVKTMLSENNYDVVIFTNFAPTVNRDFYLRSEKPIVIFDHHENALWWKSKNNPDFHVNQEYSGAMMVYMFYKRWMADIERYKEQAYLADDFELWKLKDARSFHFNTLFWKSESVYDFIKRWAAGGPLALTQAEKDMLTEHVRDWKLYYESLAQLGLEFNGRFITTNDYHAEISKQMDIEGVNYFMIYHPKSNYVTFRSCNALIDCKEILGSMQVYTASTGVGVVPCKNVEEAKKICKDIEKAILAHIPKGA